MAKEKEIQKEIVEEVGVISTTVGGWRTELNLISWNGGAVKYDIRPWNEDHAKCGKGITLTSEELFKLKDLLIQKLGR